MPTPPDIETPPAGRPDAAARGILFGLGLSAALWTLLALVALC